MNAMLILLFSLRFIHVMCSEMESAEISANDITSCTSIISNKTKPLNCLLVINAADALHYTRKFGCHMYYKLAENFLSTGDVGYGFQILADCKDTYDSLEHCRKVSPKEVEALQYDPEDLQYVCTFYQAAYDLALQQDICRKTANQVDILRTSEQSTYTTEFMSAKYITELKKLYMDGVKLMKMMDLHNLSYVLENSFVSNVTSDEMKRVVEKGMEFNKDLQYYRTLLYYVYGPVDFVLFVIGFVGNVSLIILFIRFREVRTPQNLLLLNLAFGDILNLISNIFTALIVEIIYENHFTYFSPALCKCIACLQFFSLGLSVYAVMFLSIQRYIFIRSSLKQTVCKLSVKMVVLLNILAVWIMSIGLCTPVTVLTTSDSFGICFIPKDFDPTLWSLSSIGGLPILTVTCFYTLAACRLAKSAKNIPGETQGSERTRKSRNKSAGVLLALTCVFAFSLLPYLIYLYLLRYEYISVPSYWYEYVLFKMTFLNPVANPFALYIGSGNFKRNFKRCFSRKKSRSNLSTDSQQISKSTKWTSF